MRRRPLLALACIAVWRLRRRARSPPLVIKVGCGAPPHHRSRGRRALGVAPAAQAESSSSSSTDHVDVDVTDSMSAARAGTDATGSATVPSGGELELSTPQTPPRPVPDALDGRRYAKCGRQIDGHGGDGTIGGASTATNNTSSSRSSPRGVDKVAKKMGKRRGWGRLSENSRESRDSRE